MTNEEFKELKEKAAQLWDEYEQLKKPFDRKRLEWSEAYNRVAAEKLRREVRAELEKEMASSQAQLDSAAVS